MKSSTTEQGFTLIEVIVVTVVIGIGLMIAAPALIETMQNSSLKSDANQVYNTIASVRMQAIKQGQPLAICFDTGGPNVTIYDDRGANGAWNCGGDDTLFRMIPFETNTVYGKGAATTNATTGGGALPGDGVAYNNDRLIINPQGMPDPANNSNEEYIYLTNSNQRTYAVGTLVTGATRLRRWEAGSSSWSDSP